MWRRFLTRSGSSGLLLLAAAVSFAASPRPLELKNSPARDQRVVRRWSLNGSPRGLVFGPDGILYVGLADRQSLAAIDPSTGTVVREVVLDHPEIASTKELRSVRLDARGDRILIANGSDESVTILDLPSLAIRREITLEGESIADVLADPKGRFLYVLGRTVHVFQADGEREIRNLDSIEPMAIAVNHDGSSLAVIGSEEFGSNRATVVALFDTATMTEISREPLQTDRRIQAALFAADDKALVAVARDWFAEKPLAKQPRPDRPGTGTMKLQLHFGDLVSSDSICLPADSGPQILTRGPSTNLVFFAESRCSTGASFNGSRRNVSFGSLFGIEAFALALQPGGKALFATDPHGYLTAFRIPETQHRR